MPRLQPRPFKHPKSSSHPLQGDKQTSSRAQRSTTSTLPRRGDFGGIIRDYKDLSKVIIGYLRKSVEDFDDLFKKAPKREYLRGLINKSTKAQDTTDDAVAKRLRSFSNRIEGQGLVINPKVKALFQALDTLFSHQGSPSPLAEEMDEATRQQLEEAKAALSPYTIEGTSTKLNILSSNIINQVLKDLTTINDLNSPATKINLNMVINEGSGSSAEENLTLQAGLDRILEEVDQLPDFQPEVTELFHALKIIYSQNATTSPQSEKKLKVAQSIVASYTPAFREANKCLSEIPADLIKLHNILQQRQAEARAKVENILAGHLTTPENFTLNQIIADPTFEKIRKTVSNHKSAFSLIKLLAKPVIDLIANNTRSDLIINHPNYGHFKQFFVKEYYKNRDEQTRMPEGTIKTTSEQIDEIKNKLGLRPTEDISNLSAERFNTLTSETLKHFRDTTKKQLDDFGYKAFYVRHWLDQPESVETASPSNAHYQSILLERDQEKGYRVVIMDSLGTGKRTTSPYIHPNDQKNIDTILNKIGSLCYTSITNNRIVDDGEIARRILPPHIALYADEEIPPDAYLQDGTQCGIQCVKNLIAEATRTTASGTAMAIDSPIATFDGNAVADSVVSMECDAAELANFEYPPGYDADSNRLKRELDTVTSSELTPFDIGKYSALEAWVGGQEPDTVLDEALLEEFFNDFNALITARENDKKLALKAQAQSIFQQAKKKKDKKSQKEFSIIDFDISCKPITSVTATGSVKKCEHEVSFLKGKTLKKDLVVHLPTVGQKPDVDLYKIVNSLTNAIDDLPEEKRPKHIHFSIGINGKDEEQTRKNYQHAVDLFEELKLDNADQELPFSVKIFGFEWSVTGPEGVKEFIPFGSIRNHLFDETFLEENDESLSDNCRYIQMDGDMIFNAHALRECLELKDGEYTAMPSQAATSKPKYQATKEAFELNARIQKALGDDAYLSEKMQLHGPKAMRDLIALRRQGVEIHGKSDLEGPFIDRNLQNSGCQFKAVPASEESVKLYNFKKDKYYVKSHAIQTKNDFIHWLSSLAGQGENQAGSEFFTRRLASKYDTKHGPVIHAQANIYLPTLMKNGHSLNSVEKILSALETNYFEGLNGKQKSICDQFLEDAEEILHPERQKIKKQILVQAREILNFAKEKSDTIDDDALKFNIKSFSAVSNKKIDDNKGENISNNNNTQDKEEKNKDSKYDRVNVMPRMLLPKSKKQEEIKKNNIAIPALQVSEKNLTLHSFLQLYHKITSRIKLDQELTEKYSNLNDIMIPNVSVVQSSRKKQKTSQSNKANINSVQSTRERGWDNKFERLCQFYNTYGHLKINSKNHPEYADLITWSTDQRKHYFANNKNRMTQERIEKLESIGFAWDLERVKWQKNYKKLCAFRDQHNTTVVPHTHDDQEFYTWTVNQRSHYRKFQKKQKSLITQDQVNDLNKIGFNWNPQTDRWHTRFSELLEFRQENGHCNVPRQHKKHPDLYTWCITQRGQHKKFLDGKKSNMTQSRKKQLEDIGFKWNLTRATDEQRFMELEAFRQKFGHCNVPPRYPPNQQLATWINNTKNRYKGSQEGEESEIISERITRLNAMGFDWNPYETIWNKKFERLCAFQAKYKHTNVPTNYHDKELYSWCVNQRTEYKKKQRGEKSSLTDDRIAQLRSVGFKFKLYA